MTDNLKPSYSFLIGIEKTLFRVALIGGPILLTILPEQWMNLTLSAAITFLINFVKNYNFETK